MVYLYNTHWKHHLCLHEQTWGPLFIVRPGLNRPDPGSTLCSECWHWTVWLSSSTVFETQRPVQAGLVLQIWCQQLLAPDWFAFLGNHFTDELNFQQLLLATISFMYLLLANCVIEIFFFRKNGNEKIAPVSWKNDVVRSLLSWDSCGLGMMILPTSMQCSAESKQNQSQGRANYWSFAVSILMGSTPHQLRAYPLSAPSPTQLGLCDHLV